MPSFDTLLPFLIATLLFAYIPGPAMLYTAAQTLARGRAGGLMATLGIHLGGYAHVLAATLGLSAALLYVPVLYMVVKLAGAAYLVWLGIAMIRGRMADGTLPELRGRSVRRAFAESIAVEVLNPKTALFFLAFLPQFVDPSAALPVWAQFLVLGTIVNLAFSSADLTVIWLTAAVVDRARRTDRVEKIARWIGGTVLIGLGVKMAREGA